MYTESEMKKFGWVSYFVGILFGILFMIIINVSTTHEPDINCNNESANDGPQYEERDITDYEWDVYCETPKR